MKTLLILMATAGVALAADNKPKETTIAQAAKKIASTYKDKEWSLESAYTLRTEDLDRYKESVTVGGNYWLTKGAGFHAAVALNDTDGQAIDLVEFGLAGRVAIKESPVALLFGVGAEHRFVNDVEGEPGKWVKDGKKSHKIAATEDKEDTWSVYAEAGASYRFKYFDVFGKIRGIRPVESSVGEHIAILVGASIPFTF